jgi:CheY-like chemotaxis protein
MNDKTVLIVEDDEVIRDVLQQLLQYQGYATVTANHGKDALRKLEEQPCPALLLMDLMMPVMNGWELLAALRADERWRKLPVIVLSAGGEAHELAGDTHARFLKKPLRMHALLELVQKLCEPAAK